MSGNKHPHPRDVTQGSPKKPKPSVSEVAQARIVTRTLLDAVEAIESKPVFHIGIAKLGVGNSRTSASNNGGSKSGGSGGSGGSSTSSTSSSNNNSGSNGIGSGSSNNNSGSNGIGSGSSNGSSSNNNSGSSSSSSSSNNNVGAGSSSSNNNNNSNASDAHAASGQGVQEEGGGLQSSDRQVVQFKTATKLLLSAAEVVDSKPKGGTAALGISNRSNSSSSNSSNGVGGAHPVSRQDGRGEGGKNLPRIQRNVDGILRRMVQIGNLPYLHWGDLKVLLVARMLEVVGALEKESGFVQAKGEKDYVQRRDEVVASLRKCDVAPFNVQRLAEILQEPRRHFSSTHKLMNALEKVLRVSGTAHPAVMPAEDEPPSSSLGVNRKPSPGSAIIASIRLGSLKMAPPSQVERAVRELREETEEEDGAAMIICGMAGASAASAISVDEEVEVGGGPGAGTWRRSKSEGGGGGGVCGVSGPNMEEEKEKGEGGKKKRCNGGNGKGSVRPASGDGSSNTSRSGGGGGSGSGGGISRTKGTRSSSRVRNRSGSSSSSSSKRERVGGDDQVEQAPKKKRKAATKRGARTEQEGDAGVKSKPPPKKVVKKHPAAEEVTNKKPSTQKVVDKKPATKKSVKKEEVAKAEESEAEVVKENQKTETKAAKPPTKRRARRTATLTKKGAAAAAAPAAKLRGRK